MPRSSSEVMDSSADFGVTAQHLLGAEVPIYGVAEDQQAALFGQTCFDPGMAKSTYGTGCFLMLNTGDQALVSEALGVAYLAGLKAGVFESLETLQDMWRCDKRFEPEMSKASRDKFYEGWRNAVRRTQEST